MKKTLLLMLCMAIITQMFAGGTNTWQGIGRIALSSDGNEHDHDDINATKMALMILAKAGLQDKVVLYTYADHIWGSNQTTSDQLERMHTVALGGQQKFGFQDATFMAAVEDPAAAYAAMAAEIAKSTATDPLFIIGAGPMHVIGEGLRIANGTNPDALNHVTVISHSDWNNNHGQSHKDPETTDHDGWTWNMMNNSFGSKVNFKRISDQNGTPPNVYSSNDKFKASTMADWNWMNTHQDPNVNWVYQNHTGKGANSAADYSDAGMSFYLVTGDEMGNPVKLRDYIGPDVIPVVIDPTKPMSVSLNISSYHIREIDGTYQLSATVLPETAINKNVTWSSSNSTVATVSNTGLVTGKKLGYVTITATTVEGKKTARAEFQVGVVEAADFYAGEDYVCFEAESTNSPLQKWVVRTPEWSQYVLPIKDAASPNPINNTYLEYTGGTEDGNGSGQDILVYKFTPRSTGIYYLTGRMAQNLQGAKWDKCNDIYVKMAGDFDAVTGGATKDELTTWCKFYGRGHDGGSPLKGDWGQFVKGEPHHGSPKKTMKYALKAGVEYTFSVSGRAQRTCVDYYLFYKEGAAVTVGERKDLATNSPIYMRPGGVPVEICAAINAHDFDVTSVDSYDPATKGTIPNSPADGINKGEQVIGCAGGNGKSRPIAAEEPYTGTDGDVTFTVKAVGEPDGECTYAVFINGTKVGEKQASRIHGTATAPYTYEDLVINDEPVAIQNGDIIRVTSNQVSNNLVPEGDGFATARGRWVSLNICSANANPNPDNGGEEPEPAEEPVIHSHNAPTTVDPSATEMAIEVRYTSATTVDFVTTVHKMTSTGNETNGFKRINGIQPATNGTVNITVPINPGLELGGNYRWVIYFLPSGGNWKNQYDPINLPFAVSQTTDIKGVSSRTQVYPTVFTNHINIKSDREISNVQLFNLSGVSITKKWVNQQSELLETSHVQAGIYLLNIIMESGEMIVQKVIKR